MAIGIDDLYDDDDVLVSQNQDKNQETQEELEQQEQNQNQNEDFLEDFLKTRGIDDLQKINFEDDNGNLIERNWNELSKEEKINILNMPLETQEEINNNTDDDLTKEEINLLSQIRQSNLTPTEFLKQIAGQEVEVTPQYKIDELSDDEVFILDLESRVGEMTDEEAAEALSTAKSNEDFFKRQIEGIRKEYKEREDYRNQQEEAQREQEEQEAFEAYQTQVVDAINNFNSVGNFDLNFEQEDKEELADFMLSKDQSGNNYLFEALQDPETLTKAAWFILNGEEAFNNISDYFAQQIKLVSENQYKKGLEDGKKGVQTRPTVVIDNSNKNNKQQHHRSYNSINDLDDDD